ncbi:MAG TPA: CoA transferase [Chloroflexota bacterium]|jgi:crotonobetainyl-CoA:carnitine CoA-transferase CaiB-like acyl-CoA transferase
MPLLTGCLALDLTDLKGQFAGKLLRDFGFEVIKVEPPAGDPVRRTGPFMGDVPHLEGSLRFAYLNAGKKSLTLDVEQRQGWELLLKLAEQADVLIESSAPGTLDLDALRARNPKLLVTSVTGFGQTGPHRDYACPDIVGLAMGGLMYISGDPALPPVKAPETQSYYFACAYAALGTLLALWQRGTDGQGRAVDVSIQETIASQEHMIRTFATDGQSIVRHGSQHEHVAPANVFPTSDGYVYLFVTRTHWKLLMDFWPDHPPEFDGPEWLDNDFRHEHEHEINVRVEEFTRRFRRDDLAAQLQRAGIPCLALNSPTAFMQEEHIQARQLFQPVQHPHLGSYLQTGFPLLVDGQREPAAPPPLLGQHTREILTNRLGLTLTEIELLFAQGVI